MSENQLLDDLYSIQRHVPTYLYENFERIKKFISKKNNDEKYIYILKQELSIILRTSTNDLNKYIEGNRSRIIKYLIER